MTPASPTNAVVIERIESLRSDLAEIKLSVQALSDNYQRFRESYIMEHNKIMSSVEQAHKRIDTLDVDMRKLEGSLAALKEQVQPLCVWGKVAAFIASVLGVSIIGLIWSMITGQVSLIFK